jgi:AraC-like DNA-binding protein
MRNPFRIKEILTEIAAEVAAIKEHIDKDPFKFKASSDILNELNSAHNRNVLEKAFRKAYGDGIKTYQVKARLGVAKRLIIKGKPKKMIAHKCYYASPSAFTTAFKRQFGMTPTEWEHNLKIKEIEDMLNDE